MDSKAIRKKWNNNIEIVQSSFKKNSLKVEGYGFSNIQNNGYMTLLLEISSITDLDEEALIDVKVNFYDQDGAIIYTGYEEIDGDDFDGYDTIEIELLSEGLAFDAVRCRVYAKKEW